MPRIDTTEGLMVWIMNRLSEAFGPRAILRGGMILRLLDCPRHTNDLDYVLVPYRSKKEIVDRMLVVLSALEGANVSYSMHSRCVRFLVDCGGIKTQVEAHVAMECKTEELSTTRLANAHNQQGRIIRVMSLDVALAHKLSAWNERRLMRDLYDAYFMHAVMDVVPDPDTLARRLRRISFSPQAGKPKGARRMSTAEFLDDLRRAAADLDQHSVVAELRDFLSADDLAGLAAKMKIGVRHLIDTVPPRKE